MNALEKIEHEIDKVQLRLNVLRNRAKTMPPGGLIHYETDLCRDLRGAGDTVVEWTKGLNDDMREAGS
jgi:hypothetical protein